MDWGAGGASRALHQLAPTLHVLSVYRFRGEQTRRPHPPPSNAVLTAECWFSPVSPIHSLNGSSRFRMHPCLNVDEILRLLACELVASEAKATAAALARCCKTFEEPVLDVLWETQDQLTPLLKCFPREIWEDEYGSLVSPITTLIFSVLNRLISKDFQESSDGSGMDPLTKIYPKSAEPQSGDHKPAHPPNPAAPYCQRPLASRAQILRVCGSN